MIQRNTQDFNTDQQATIHINSKNRYNKIFDIVEKGTYNDIVDEVREFGKITKPTELDFQGLQLMLNSLMAKMKNK